MGIHRLVLHVGLQPLEDDALVGGVLVYDQQSVPLLHQNVGMEGFPDDAVRATVPPGVRCSVRDRRSRYRRGRNSLPACQRYILRHRGRRLRRGGHRLPLRRSLTGCGSGFRHPLRFRHDRDRFGEVGGRRWHSPICL